MADGAQALCRLDGFARQAHAVMVGLVDAVKARTQAQARARALVAMAADDLGRDEPGRPARPLLRARVDVSHCTVTEGGQVEVNVPGAMPRLSAALVESLVANATVQAVLFDRATPLAVAHGPQVPRRTGSRQVPLATVDGARRTQASSEWRTCLAD